MNPILIPLIGGSVGVPIIACLFWWIKRESAGTTRMKEIASYIKEGAHAYLKREVVTISYVIIPFAIGLFFILGWEIAFGFFLGALFSIIAIITGMSGAVIANVRTTNAALTSPGRALILAFRGGSIMGFSVVSLILLGICSLYILFGVGPSNPEAVHTLVGFGLGASLSAMFAQIGGGIYTKAADIGADLVGKTEVGMVEDDPRNPAVIADLVGDNVGDCAGRGSDLFESSADNLVCIMIIGLTFLDNYGWNAVMFPLYIRGIGKIATIIGVFSVRKWGKRGPLTSLNIGLLSALFSNLILFYVLSLWLMKDIRIFYCLSVGILSLFVGTLIVQYYTGIDRSPVKKIAKGSQTGTPIGILTGFSFGLESAMFSMLLIGGVIILGYQIMDGGLLGIFGLAMATLGMTEMKGMMQSIDTYGPISDNAAGIAEMSGLSKEARKSLDTLDAAGNVTKAITKGYGLTKSVLSSIVILFAYIFVLIKYLGITMNDISDIALYLNLANPHIIVSLLIGASIPFLFSALLLRATSRAASKMVDEVRRQFKEISGLLRGDEKPDYSRCIDISTKNSLKEMIFPILVGLVAPVIIGFTLGVWPLAAFQIGLTIMGALLAVFMFNSGGAWDNSKKYIEDGHYGGKGSTAHKAAVVTDTVGDPMKDTVGPSLHILIKLSNIFSITLLPVFLLVN
ncbi:MAG: vacuolar-type H(+)-translocating inorganic pyrophosphatase [Candidatus Scalindua rubra]|uniref:K(+)-insensitive pyrophosphate-energized proton pump n=1 Tax=Candidatus Scalindua rubra TaxID=1872076 RepID=A0A1E3XCE1_9BACT|nr:MAG: vacuolar-type H(+)-translocating inorganic pyrophosphatase [Candidatus Scalindua rubra]